MALSPRQKKKIEKTITSNILFFFLLLDSSLDFPLTDDTNCVGEEEERNDLGWPETKGGGVDPLSTLWRQREGKSREKVGRCV